MKIKDWMTRVPVTVSPTTSIAKAQEVMLSRRIRHLPVVEADLLVGILSDRDVRTVLPSPATSLVVGEIRYLFERLKVREVMTRGVITVSPEETLGEAARLMVSNKFGSLPVVASGRLVGIITDLDLLRAFGASLGTIATPAPKPTAPGPRKILVPLDGTAGSEAVLESVGDLARAEGYTVRLLHVAPPVHEVRVDDRIVAYADQETGRVEHEIQHYFRRLAPRLGEVPIEFVVEFGDDPVAQIVREAESPGVELIAMATHRRTGLSRVVRGSVAEEVERATSVPVMLVRYGAESFV